MEERTLDHLLTLLFSLLRIADLPRDDDFILMLASIEEIIAGVLSESLSDQERQYVISTLLEVIGKDISIASAIERINTTVYMLRGQGINGKSMQVKGISINHILEDLLALYAIVNSHSVGHADILMTNINVFNYIHKIRIEPENNNPYTVIIGTLSEQQDMLVSLSNNSYIERRTELIHSSTSPYPKLNLKTPSKRRPANWRSRRFDWLQRGLPEDDLEVYTYQERRVGNISTRELNLPYIISGKKHQIIIPEQVGTALFETSIRNEQGTVLMHCIRVWPTT